MFFDYHYWKPTNSLARQEGKVCLFSAYKCLGMDGQVAEPLLLHCETETGQFSTFDQRKTMSTIVRTAGALVAMYQKKPADRNVWFSFNRVHSIGYFYFFH